MSWRRILVAGSVVFFVLALPGDVQSIRESLASPDRRLALGLSLKTLMAVLAIVGLELDKTFGYAFLLGITLQSLLIKTGAFLGAFPAAVDWLAVAEILFRLNCLVFLFVYRGRLVGRR